MTSQINYQTIDTTFPKAGKDNDSQGFRDNFAATAAGLSVAKTEISALQQSAILAVDLATGTQPVVNDLLGSTISNGVYNQFHRKSYNGGSVSTPTNVNISNGAVQRFILTGDSVLTFTNWPSGSVYAECRVIVTGNYTPTFQSENSRTIVKDVNFPVVSGQRVKAVTISGTWTNFSSGTTTVTFSAPQLSGGVTATGVAIINAGSVVGVNITNPGSGYTSAPTCTIVDSDVGSEVTGTSVSLVSTMRVYDAWTIPDDNNVYVRFVGEY